MYHKLVSFFSFLMCALCLSSSVHAQKEAIEGHWFTEEKDAKIRIFKATNGKYYGKVIWLQEPDRNGQPKLDINNPKEANRSTPVMELQILRGFSKKSATSFEDGTIYDPKTGKTYSCKITMKDNNTLHLRGYVGVSMLGRTTVWTRTGT